MAGEATKTLTYRFGADLSQLGRDMAKGEELARSQQRELAKLQKQQREHRATIEDLGRGYMTFGAVVAAGLGLSAKAAIEWESAFAGVKKTVDGSDQEIAALEGELRKLARTLPATHQEIAAVAEAAGQLGIKRADVAGFTKTMIDLGNTTNLTAEDAATSLAKFSNIMGTSAKDVDRLGSALVALGNDGASTEADIIAMALRIAASGKLIGLTEGQVLGFASALSSVGINAEAGGSSMSRVMKDIQNAVQTGSDKLDIFAKVAGQTTTEFRRSFQDDAGAAITAFLAGLGKMQSQGENVIGVLDSLALGDIIVSDTLLRASSASDMFTKSLKVGTSAWAENRALTDEAAKRYETTASKLKVAGNQIKDAMIDVGASIAPMVSGVAQGGSDLVRFFQELPGPVREVVTWVGAAVAIVTLFGGAAAVAAPRVLAFRESMRALEASGGAASGALGKFGLLMTGPWGAAIGIGATLLGVFGAASGAASRRQDDLAAAGKRVADVIAEQNGAINDTVINTAAKELSDRGLLKMAKDLSIELGSVTDAFLEQGEALPKLRDRLNDLIKAGTTYRNDAHQGRIRVMTEEARKAKELLDGLDELVGTMHEQNEAADNTTDATKGAAEAQQSQTKVTEDQTLALEKAKKAFDDLVDAMNAANGVTLTYREAQRDYKDQLKETAEILAKNGKGLDDNTEAGSENATALDAQAIAAGKLADAAGREAEKVGGAAAGHAALTASLAASRQALIDTAIAFGMSPEAAAKYVDSVLAASAGNAELNASAKTVQTELGKVKTALEDVPPGKMINVGVLSEAARQKLTELGYQVLTLPDGTVSVVALTGTAQTDLNNFISRNQGLTITARIAINTAAVAKEVRYIQGLSNAYGNVVRYAGGGVAREDHQPQFARAVPGTVRVWAEDEAGGETYLPWRMDKRPKATEYLRYTANEWGYDLIPRTRQVASFAGGGVYGGGPVGGQVGASAVSPAALAAAATVLATMLGGARLELGDGFARFVRLNTRANGRR